jgi:hypothetical protein
MTDSIRLARSNRKPDHSHCIDAENLLDVHPMLVQLSSQRCDTICSHQPHASANLLRATMKVLHDLLERVQSRPDISGLCTDRCCIPRCPRHSFQLLIKMKPLLYHHLQRVEFISKCKNMSRRFLPVTNEMPDMERELGGNVDHGNDRRSC